MSSGDLESFSAIKNWFLGMLHEFIASNRAEIVRRCRSKVAARKFPEATSLELERGIPLFLDQLIEELCVATNTTVEIEATAARHGGDLLRFGFTIGQVVHDYGDVCQSITELAEETEAPITVDEFHTLNRCLDNAIAGAVTEFTRAIERLRNKQEAERSGTLAHELRNCLNAAMLAFGTLKSGLVGIGGSTGAVLERNLRAIRNLVDRSLTEVRIDMGAHRSERIQVREFLKEVELDASLEATARGIQFSVGPVDADIVVEADRPILAAALANLLQNGMKFSRPGGHVSLITSASASKVIFMIEDECGGLPIGSAEDLFLPYTQRSTNREGLGLGLSITRKGVEANGGSVSVQDLPAKGCRFSISIPRIDSLRV